MHLEKHSPDGRGDDTRVARERTLAIAGQVQEVERSVDAAVLRSHFLSCVTGAIRRSDKRKRTLSLEDRLWQWLSRSRLRASL